MPTYSHFHTCHEMHIVQDDCETTMRFGPAVLLYKEQQPLVLLCTDNTVKTDACRADFMTLLHGWASFHLPK